MLKNANRTEINGLCENVGRLCIAAACAYSAFVIIATAFMGCEDDDYQDRLRKAYEGLSPEEY